MHQKKIINNSIISVLYRVALLALGFVSRKIFIVYIGEELLGLNSLYTNLLELLNLADLGIGVAVQYQLYEPLVNKDYARLSKIMAACRKLYNAIGLFIFAAGAVLSLFIQHLIKSTTYPIWFVRVAFLISVAGVAAGYLFVHKRLFLQANEELGLVNILDFAATLTTVIVSLIATVLFHNYFVYLAINSLNGLATNLLVHFFFTKKYPEVVSDAGDTRQEIAELTGNLKNVVPMKLSNFVYNSTDNIIISKVLGLVTVAFYSNYMTIINGIMRIEYLFGNVITASLGKIIKEEQDSRKVFEYYLLYQYVQFMLTGFCTVSLAVLCRPFITLWVGERFVLPLPCVVLLILDFFVHSMYQPAAVMYGAAGKFREDKYVTAVSAVSNLVISIGLVLVIGLPGVIVGTLVTDLYIWVIRSHQVVGRFFEDDLGRYTRRMIGYCASTAVGLGLTLAACRLVTTENGLLELVLKAAICCVVPNAVNLAATCRSREFGMTIQYVKSYIKRGRA